MRTILVRFVAFLAVIGASQAAIKPQIIKTPGGLTAWYFYDKATPVISISFLFKGGARLDPEGKAGVADFTTSLLNSGTVHKDPNEFDAYKQDYAIQLSFSTDSDKVGGELTTLVQHKDKAFDLLKEVFTSPRLKQDIFDNIMNMSRTSLANQTNDPSYLARRRLDTMLFKNHPYENPPEGLPQTISKITLKDIGSYIKDNLTQDKLQIAITGNIDEAHAIKMLDSTFGVLPKKSAEFKSTKTKPAINGQHDVIELKIPQSLIFFVLPGVTYDDPDFIKAALLMHIMGEEQSSRLFQEIREKRGLAYVVSASAIWRQDAGYIGGMVGSPKAKAAQSIELLKQEWARLKKDGITAEELDGAKTFMMNSYPLRFRNSSAISAILLGYQFVGRPVDYFQKREEMIAAITLKDMNDFITRVIEPEKLTFVVVGRPDEAPAKQEEKK